MTAQNLPPDYLDAMERHWLDAEHLLTSLILILRIRRHPTPHTPLFIPWNQSFAAIQSHHARLEGVDPRLVDLIFGELIADLQAMLKRRAA